MYTVSLCPRPSSHTLDVVFPEHSRRPQGTRGRHSGKQVVYGCDASRFLPVSAFKRRFCQHGRIRASPLAALGTAAFIAVDIMIVRTREREREFRHRVHVRAHGNTYHSCGCQQKGHANCSGRTTHGGDAGGCGRTRQDAPVDLGAADWHDARTVRDEPGTCGSNDRKQQHEDSDEPEVVHCGTESTDTHLSQVFCHAAAVLLQSNWSVRHLRRLLVATRHEYHGHGTERCK